MSWHLLSTHGLVLAFLYREPLASRPQIAAAVGITERHVSRVLADLVEAGFIRRERSDGRYVYRVDVAAAGRHPLVRDIRVGAWLEVLGKEENR